MSEILEHHSLQNHHTFGIACKARFFTKVSDVQELKEALIWGQKQQVEVLILGGGSNVLFTQDFDGLVLINAMTGVDIQQDAADEVILSAGAGEVWHDLVMYCVNHGFGGIENLSLIPGTVGAAPMQNIGAYGVEIKEVFESLTALNRETLEVETFTKEDCQFGYRQSVFKRELKGQYVITSVTLRLQKNAQINVEYGAIKDVLVARGIKNPGIREVSEAVIEIRQSKLPDPAQIGNSGSFFKNPVIEKEQFEQLQQRFPNVPHYPNGEQVKVPAGWLIEQCGWKGKRRGQIGVHDKQALVLVNHGGGEGAAVWQLAQDIQEAVQHQFGVRIEPEVNVI